MEGHGDLLMNCLRISYNDLSDVWSTVAPVRLCLGVSNMIVSIVNRVSDRDFHMENVEAWLLVLLDFVRGANRIPINRPGHTLDICLCLTYLQVFQSSLPLRDVSLSGRLGVKTSVNVIPVRYVGHTEIIVL